MSIFGRQDDGRERLADELAGLKAEIKALRTERDKTAQLTRLGHDVETLKLEKAQLVEENLAADKQRFAGEMTFQRKHLQGEVDRIESILGKILDRLPTIEVELTGPAKTRKASRGELD